MNLKGESFMTIKNKSELSPYYDDYDPEKGFHAVLFKPGFTVQTRELNQMQSLLRESIQNLGSGFFANRSIVQGDGITIKQKQYLKVIYSGTTTAATLSPHVGTIWYLKNTKGLKAIVDVYTLATGADPVTFHVSYINSGDNGVETAFGVGDVLTLTNFNSIGTELEIGSVSLSAIGSGTIAIGDENVMMIDDIFLKTNEFSIPGTKYSINTEMRVGYKIVESIITSGLDNSLFSNASGEPNFNGEGADRYKLELIPTIKEVSDLDDEDFIEITRITTDGIGVEKASRVDWSVIRDEMAKGIYEESGDFTVNSFEGYLREHLDSGTNDGLKTLADGGDKDKFAITIKGGVGYVRGYRVSNDVTSIPIDKSRDVKFVNNHAVATVYGNYINVNNYHSLPPIDLEKVIDLYSTPHAGAGSMGVGVKIGSCNVRYAQTITGSILRLYIFNVKLDAGKTMSDVLGVYYSDANNLFAGTMTTSAVRESSINIALFDIGLNATKTLKPSGSPDTSYIIMKEFNVTTDGFGKAIISAGGGNYFDATDTLNYLCARTDGSNTGAVFNLFGKIALSGTPVGQNLDVNLGAAEAGQDIKILAPIIKTGAEKVKTKTTFTEDVTFTGDNAVALSKVDVFGISSVIITGDFIDVTDAFTFDSGMRDSFYDVGSLKTVDGLPITGTFTVTYEHFNASVGDYFSVDSYSSISYDDIPIYASNSGEIFDLRDSIDFRPYKNNTGEFTGVVGNMVKPNDTIRADVEYYLPRVDVVYITKDGKFGSVRGIPSTDPAEPNMVENAMMLYRIDIPAYTFSTENIQVYITDNQRFTMRDIGSLQTRIETLEKHVTLNQNEQSLNNTTVYDAVTGLPKYKNGFVSDNFTDYNLMDTTSVEFSASIDIQEGILKPNFDDAGLDLDVVTNTGGKQAGLKIFNDYTEKLSVTQIYATKMLNINPHNSFSFIGDIILTPERDFWKDRLETTPIIMNMTTSTYLNSSIKADILKAWNDWIQSKPWVSTIDQNSDKYTVTNTFTSMAETSGILQSNKAYTIEHMRSKIIQFNGYGFKPFTKVVPYFDDKDVSSDCAPSSGGYGNDLVTDANGNIVGTFKIPNTNHKRFKVGETTFKLSDSTSTAGTAIYSAKRDGLGISNNTKQAYSRVMGAESIRGNTLESIDDIIGWKDHVAQVFNITSENGEFISGIDIFFSAKDATYPVTLEISKCQAGTPTMNIVPGGFCSKIPADINISTDASMATRFNFIEPIYLEAGSTYSFMLNTNSRNYHVYAADDGSTDIGIRKTATQQPNIGSFWKSKGEANWSEFSSTAIKFNLYRCVFDIVNPAVLEFKCTAPTSVPGGYNCITTAINSINLIVKHINHGLKTGDIVTIEDAEGGRGVQLSDLNKTHSVTAYTQDTFTITSSNAATHDSTIGGSNIRLTMNHQFSLMHLLIDSLNFNNTNIDWEYSYLYQDARGMSGYIPFTPNKNFNLSTEGVVRQTGDLLMKATMTTSNDSISPIIDLDGSTIALVGPRLGDTNSYNYITKTISFSNTSTTLKLYVNAKVPTNNDMTVYYKLLSDNDQNTDLMTWVELLPDSGTIIHSDKFTEQIYTLEGQSFIGVKIKIAFTGTNRIMYPEMYQLGAIGFI